MHDSGVGISAEKRGDCSKSLLSSIETNSSYLKIHLVILFARAAVDIEENHSHSSGQVVNTIGSSSLLL